MKSGFSTNAFVNHPLSFAIKSIANIGFDGIEIVLDVPHIFLPITKDFYHKKCKIIQFKENSF